MESFISFFHNTNNIIALGLIIGVISFYIIILLAVRFYYKKEFGISIYKKKSKNKEVDTNTNKYKSFIIKDDKKLSRNDLFSNCLINGFAGQTDYYRFSFEDIDDIRLYIACIYDENDNRADVKTTIGMYSDLIEFIDVKTELVNNNKEIAAYTRYKFNLENALKYINEFTIEKYETEKVLGLNNIIHGHSEDGYIDFYIIIGDEVFESDFYDMIKNALNKNFLDRRSKLMEDMSLEELECENESEGVESEDYSYENETVNASEYIDGTVTEAFIDDLKDTAEQVQDLVNRVNEVTGSNITIGGDAGLDIEEEIVEEPCDLLRYITYKDENGEEQEIQVKHLPKKFDDWETRFADELTGTEIDKVNELYGKWYSKKNKGKEITLPDGRKANINTGETSSIGGGSGNIMAEAISALSESNNSGAGALLGALASMASAGNVTSNMNQQPHEEPKGPQFDIDKLQESVDNNTK